MPQAASAVEKFAVRGERIARDFAAAVGDDIAAAARRRSRGSSCLSVPAVALRGLANGSSPAATTAAFIRSNSAVGM